MTKLQEYWNNKQILRPRLEELRSLVSKNPLELTIWVGAGFGKKYADLPTWRELLLRLNKRLTKSNTSESDLVNSLINHNRLQIAAELLTELHSDNVVKVVCEMFENPKFRPDEIPLRSIAPGTVITTNYDSILDTLYSDYRIVDPSQPVENIFNFRPRLIKLHGSVDDPKSIVLSVTSYAKAYSKEFEWFLLHQFQNSTILFVGAGLNDAEPYLRFLQLLSSLGMRHGHHFALLPYPQLKDKKATNKAIADHANRLGTIGIQVLPYVVSEPSDHDFVDEFLAALMPEQTNKAIDDVVRRMTKTLKSLGPDAVGSQLFRCLKSLDEKHVYKRPMQNLLSEFLETLRQDKRYDLCSEWYYQVENIVSLHENAVKYRYSEERGISKFTQVELNKAFLYNVQKRNKN